MPDDYVEKLIAGIARTHVPEMADRGFMRLNPKKSDSLDFFTVSVQSIRDALEEAYNCGFADAKQQANQDA